MIKKSGLPITLEIVTRKELAGGQYISETKTMQMVSEKDMEDISKELLHFDIHLSGKELAEITCAHELGHALDSHLPYRKRKLFKYLDKINKCLSTYDENRLKLYYKKISKLVMENEMVAWKLSKRLLSSSINEKEWTKNKNRCLTSYRRTIQYEFKHYINTMKFLRKLEQSPFPFPKNIAFQCDMYGTQENRYDSSQNIFYMYAKQSIYNRDKPYKQMSASTYMLYDCLYRYLKEKHQIKPYQTYRNEFVQICDYIDKDAYIQNAKESLLQNETKVFDILRPHFGHEKSFNCYETNKMSELQRKLSLLDKFKLAFS